MTMRQKFSQFIASINIQRPQYDAFMAVFDAFYPAAKAAEQTEMDVERRSRGSVRTAIRNIEDGPAIEGTEIAVITKIEPKMSPSEQLQADLEPLP